MNYRNVTCTKIPIKPNHIIFSSGLGKEHWKWNRKKPFDLTECKNDENVLHCDITVASWGNSVDLKMLRRSGISSTSRFCAALSHKCSNFNQVYVIVLMVIFYGYLLLDSWKREKLISFQQIKYYFYIFLCFVKSDLV